MEVPEGSAKRSSLTLRPAELMAANRRSFLFPMAHRRRRLEDGDEELKLILNGESFCNFKP